MIPANKEKIIELKYHHCATSNKWMVLGTEDPCLLTSKKGDNPLSRFLMDNHHATSEVVLLEKKKNWTGTLLRLYIQLLTYRKYKEQENVLDHTTGVLSGIFQPWE